MVEVFKRLNIAACCLGNHDTDFGLEKMQELIQKTQGIWLMSNLYLHDAKRIVGDLPRSHVITHKGYKIGLFGLCESEWLGLLNPYTITEKLIYVDFIVTAKEISQ